jgi:putative glycosyltransferase (TIGR04372 family)
MVTAIGWLFRLLIRQTWIPIQIEVVVMEPRFFGHQCLEPEVFLMDSHDSQKPNRLREMRFACLGKRANAANRTLWNLRKKQLRTIPSWLVSEVVRQEFGRSSDKIVIRHADYHRLNRLTQTPRSLPNSREMSSRYEAICECHSVARRPLVIVTVREATTGDGDLRNRRIADFQIAIETLVGMGYNVIRLTHRTADPAVFRLAGFIDHQVSRDGLPGDELALIANCEFVISTTTGIDCLALAYRKPVLYIDAARFFYMFLGTELATCQLPRFSDAQTGLPVSLVQMLDRGLGWVKHSEAFGQAGVRVHNSSPAEIARTVAYFEQHILRCEPAADARSQNWWRESLLERHGREIEARHGQIRAKLLSSE